MVIKKKRKRFLNEYFLSGSFAVRCSCLFSNSNKVCPNCIHGNARPTPDSIRGDPWDHPRKSPMDTETWHPLQCMALTVLPEISLYCGFLAIPTVSIKWQERTINIPLTSAQKVPLHFHRRKIYGKKNAS